jgi:two-component system chemotaxis sensor kinase CheA
MRKVLPLIFHSGVTTSPIITDISGRGLGLAIVQEKVGKLGGLISCESKPLEGTTFRMTLPLSLSTYRGVLVRVDEHLFVIPTINMERMKRIKKDEIKTVENRETVLTDGQAIPFMPLYAALELPQRVKKSEDEKFIQTVVLNSAEKLFAFSVDEVLNEQDVLVKGLGRQLSRIRNIAGATVLGTGRVVPILNIPDLIKSAVKLSASPARVTAAPEESLSERKSILVVEDSITARTLLKNILETAGYDVKSAVDGIEAFTLLKTEYFDMVVSDIDMPRMNGFDLTAKIRADKKLSEMPVALVTALDSREDRERGIDAGANAYIVKSSFDQSNLLEVVRRLI